MHAFQLIFGSKLLIIPLLFVAYFSTHCNQDNYNGRSNADWLTPQDSKTKELTHDENLRRLDQELRNIQTSLYALEGSSDLNTFLGRVDYVFGPFTYLNAEYSWVAIKPSFGTPNVSHIETLYALICLRDICDFGVNIASPHPLELDALQIGAFVEVEGQLIQGSLAYMHRVKSFVTPLETYSFSAEVTDIEEVDGTPSAPSSKFISLDVTDILEPDSPNNFVFNSFGSSLIYFCIELCPAEYTLFNIDLNKIKIGSRVKITADFYPLSLNGTTYWIKTDKEGVKGLTKISKLISPISEVSELPGRGINAISFEWETISDALEYDIEVYDLSKNGETYINLKIPARGNESTQSFFHRDIYLERNGHYFSWRIRAVTENGPGQWSDQTRFNLKIPQPKSYIYSCQLYFEDLNGNFIDPVAGVSCNSTIKFEKQNTISESIFTLFEEHLAECNIPNGDDRCENPALEAPDNWWNTTVTNNFSIDFEVTDAKNCALKNGKSAEFTSFALTPDIAIIGTTMTLTCKF